MTLAQARAMCQSQESSRSSFEPCCVFEEDVAGDRTALRRLAAWLLRFAPIVALDEPDGLLADVTGCEALFALQHSVRVEIADREGVFDRSSRSEGALQEGLGSEGALQEGLGSEGALQEGLGSEGALQEGLGSEGALQEGLGSEGALQEGLGSEGALQEGPGSAAEHAFLTDLHGRLRRFGVTARVAIAGSVGAAWGVSRFGSSAIVAVPHDGERAVLSPLPIEALRLDESDVAALREVQVERVHQVFDLERDELAGRFAHATKRSSATSGGRSSPSRALGNSRNRCTSCDPLRRIDQALGRLPEPLHPVRLALSCRVERVFAGPVSDRETLEIAAADLLQRLCRRLKRRERGARTMRLEAVRSDASPVVIEVHLGRPSRRRGHLWSLLAPRLETLHMGFGVDALVLSAPRVARMATLSVSLDITHADHTFLRKSGLTDAASLDAASLDPASLDPASLDPGSLDPGINECIDVLMARFGPASVMRPMPAAIHEPEGFARLVAVTDEPSEPNEASADLRDAQHLAVLPRAERPTALWATPEAITVEGGTKAPFVALHWRGQRHGIVAVAGSERIDDRWWTGTAKDLSIALRTRLYRRVLLENGLWLWIWLDPAIGRWFVQGAWL